MTTERAVTDPQLAELIKEGVAINRIFDENDRRWREGRVGAEDGHMDPEELRGVISAAVLRIERQHWQKTHGKLCAIWLV